MAQAGAHRSRYSRTDARRLETILTAWATDAGPVDEGRTLGDL